MDVMNSLLLQRKASVVRRNTKRTGSGKEETEQELEGRHI
jgi:hypothetical protein